MTNKPIVIGVLSIIVALLMLGNQALSLLMEKDDWATPLFLSDLMDTQWMESIGYISLLATTPLYMLLGGLGIFLIILGAFLQQ